MKISGTFLDEITHDIPAQNWGPKEWAADFDAMSAAGIDTVILIRAGYQKQATFNSKVLQKKADACPVHLDLVDLFLSEAERCGMNLLFGTYDSGEHWIDGDYDRDLAINKEFCSEVVDRYGDRKAFKGWYLCHEIDTYNPKVMRVYDELSSHLKNLKDGPILISPYIKGVKQFGDKAISLEEHGKEWEKVFREIEGKVDIVAFQDGQVSIEELNDYMSVNQELASRHGIQSWSNVESFDRDMPIKFPPIGFEKLLTKIEAAGKAGVDKLITFEFSHFMSPNSSYFSARHLYNRYMEWLRDGNIR